jgi:site-specific DNA-adenine methylase
MDKFTRNPPALAVGRFKAPVAYQGGKTRLAADIIDYMAPALKEANVFYDLCCGCGAVSIELVSRGFDPHDVYMIDTGPFGIVWQYIGEGHFSLGVFKSYIDAIPKDRAKIKGFMDELSKQPASIDTPYVYLLLQASTFGGKALWIENGGWSINSFRSYWMPTETSNRRSPVNPMMPLPATLYERLGHLCEGMQGVHAQCADCQEAKPGSDGVVYIDPPYAGTAGYGSPAFDVVKFAQSLIVPCYVSEGRALTDRTWCLSKNMKKGGMSGSRATANEEWLSRFN